MIDLYTQLGCAVVAFMLVPYLWHTGAGLQAVLAPLCYGIAIGMFNIWMLVPEDLQWPTWAAGIHGMLVIYVGVIFLAMCNPPLRNNLIAILLWGIVLLAEAYTLLFENVLCNFIMGDQDGASEYICGRIFGPEFTTLPLAIFTAALAWVGLKWKHPRIRTPLRQ